LKLEEIAKLTNVSVSTVSRALSGKGHMSTATRERILAAAARLGFRPSSAGRALVTGRRETVGIVLESWYTEQGEWGLKILAGLSDTLEKHDCQTIVYCAESNDQVVPPMVQKRMVDGVVVVLSSSPSFRRELRERGMPLVVVDPAVPVDCDSVRPDDLAGTRLATEYLLELGHRAIAYIGVESAMVEHIHRERWSGFVQAMSQAGLPVNPGSEQPGSVQQLLDRVWAWGRPTALVCYNDFVATEAIGWLRAHGLEVPRDVSVTGCDNMAYLAFSLPRQTTLDLPYEQMGATAAQMILERIESPDLEVRHVVLPEKLVARDSTAPPRC